MNRQRQCNTQATQHQRGAVAIIVAICLTLLIGMLGLVLDLGHLYVAKTELQNAADAAALSGAKELDGSLAGVNSAVTRAIEAAGKNKYDLNSKVISITSSNIEFSYSPDGPWVNVANAQANPADKTFLKVDTGSRSLSTWFIQVLPTSATTTQTFGMAVAGKHVVDITPIAICRLPDPGTTNELGYERGVSYKVSEANPIGPGTMYWIDPESADPGVCPVTSTNATRPYVCAGKIGFTPIVGQTVNTNTGVSDPQLAALDSRFDLYPSQSQCDPATAPPDTNIKEYIYSESTAGSPSRWMGTDATQQSLTFVDQATNGLCKPSNPCKPKPYSLRTVTDYGVLWSGYRPSGATVSQWSALYSGNTATNYPETSPYAQTSTANGFFNPPSVAHQPGKAGRRVLNMVIVNCSTAGGVCRPATVLGIGKFLMQKRANQPSDKELYVEFGGLLPTPLPTSDIKLYQ
ncbi:MAG: Tad domain-containing protein [Methylotenera sp.]|nr:Tad domain-containing protein [Methylotenera sp.]MDP2280890.1 Tad domain-containing protein [Methylotenera sp.]MDP3060988.1 Tad domain-containing protein [Methylotenera sp.]